MYLIVINSTFSGNITKSQKGGAIYNGFNASIGFCTFYNNFDPSNLDGNGDGVFNSRGSLTLKNSILFNSNGPNCGGSITSEGHNLSSDGTCGGGDNDLLHTDPQLFPLADNGGPTLTHAFIPTSPAFNAGDGTGLVSGDTDQRGQPRIRYGAPDIGAVEMAWQPGDVNGSGSVDAEDLNRLLQIYVGMWTPTAGELAVGDVQPASGNGVIDGADLNWTLRRFLGLVEEP